ncbi:CocE/NonD family hydrolase [Sorangium sp. So ce1097]|uniref:CocE/NonD family hydrolase n=1 Tax=Sorangium sp. So ce1097 TaxID=3133330 RepID=UPI003F61B644
MATGAPWPASADHVREAHYVAVRGGLRCAVYVFRPARDEVPIATPMPVVWMHNRYHRGQPRVDKLAAWRARFPWLPEIQPPAAAPGSISLDHLPWLPALLARGYVIGVVDARGTGASFGRQDGPFSPEEADDARELSAWFAAQPWCNGSVGMFGRSYMGTNQLLAAATAPPHLKAIFPEMAMFDLYGFLRSGGIFRLDFARNWSADVAQRDHAGDIEPLPVPDGAAMLAEARAQRASSRDPFAMFAKLDFRDDVDAATGERPYLERDPARRAEGVRRAGVAVYLLAGWYDPWVRDALLWFANLDNPRRLVIGPWSHDGDLGFDMGAEHARWFDLSLRGVDDGISGEAPIHYYTAGAPPGQRWRTASTWPIPEAANVTYYLREGPSGSVRSVNDGLLCLEPPVEDEGADRYRADPTTTSGPATRWTNAYGGPFGYLDMRGNDEKGLTYTTRPLEEDLEITGHPVVSLWVESSAGDGDFFAYLEEVRRDGSSEYVTEGALRASHRALGPPPYEALGLPYHPSRAADCLPLGEEPALLTFDLLPLSRRFAQGSRIRLTVTCADRDNAETPAMAEPPLVDLLRSRTFASSIVLPVVAAPRGRDRG